MIVLLFLGLLATVISGIVVYVADQNLSPLAGFVDGAHEKLWEEVHEIIAFYFAAGYRGCTWRVS